MHGAVLLDRNDEVLRPALIWCDERTAAECRYLNQTIGAQRLVELTSNPALTNFTLTKLLWVRTNEPGNLAEISQLSVPKDDVRLRLAGVRAIDWPTLRAPYCSTWPIAAGPRPCSMQSGSARLPACPP